MKKVINYLAMALACLSMVLTACQKPDVSYAKIDSMAFESPVYTLQEGEDKSMANFLTILPKEVGDTVTVQWTIADPEIATVSAYGTVEALKEGKTTLNAAAMGVQTSCEIEVEPLSIKDFSIPATMTVYINEPAEIEVTDLQPKRAPLYRIKWTSSVQEVMPVLENNKWIINTDYIGKVELKATTGKLEERVCNVTIKHRPITQFTLSQTELAMVVGQEESLQLTLEPANASFADYEWSSTNKNVVTVDQQGNITAVGAGEAQVNVTHYPANEHDALKEATCTIIVTETPPVTDFEVDVTSVSVVRNKATRVTVTSVQPAGASAKTLKWQIEDTSIAKIVAGTVDGSAKQINGLKVGTTKLTISSANNVSKTVIIKVLPIEPTAVTWDFDGVCIWKGTQVTLPAPTIVPADADITAIYYSVKSISSTSNKVNTDDYDSGDIAVRVKVEYKDKNKVTQSIYSDQKYISSIPLTYKETKGFESPTTTYYGTFGMSHNYQNFNYDDYQVKPTIKGYVNQSLTTSGSYAAAKFNSDKSLVYYVKAPKVSYDNRFTQTNTYVSKLKYSIQVTDDYGVTKYITAPDVTLRSSFLGIAYKYTDDNAFSYWWNGNGADDVEMWLDDFAKEPDTYVSVEGSPTVAQAMSMYVYNASGYVSYCATEAQKSWPANSYSVCYVGVEAGDALGVDPLKVTFKK